MVSTLPIKQFRGLRTNLDGSDADLSFQAIAKNIKYHPGYIEHDAKALASLNLGLASGETILWFGKINLESDKLRNTKDTDDSNNFIADYIYSNEELYLLITNLAGTLQFKTTNSLNVAPVSNTAPSSTIGLPPIVTIGAGTYQVTVSTIGAGSGSISITGTGVTQDGNIYTIPFGTNVTITATPDEASSFVSFYGSLFQSLSNPYTGLLTDANQILSAVFERDIYNDGELANETLVTPENYFSNNAPDDVNSIIVVNENGIVKIFTDKDSYWMGKLDRYVKINDEVRHYLGTFVDRLVESFPKVLNDLAPAVSGSDFINANGRRLSVNLQVDFLTDIAEAADTNQFELIPNGVSTDDRVITFQGANLEYLLYKFIDADGNRVVNPLDEAYHVKSGQGGGTTTFEFVRLRMAGLSALAFASIINHPNPDDDIYLVPTAISEFFQINGTAWNALTWAGSTTNGYLHNPFYYVENDRRLGNFFPYSDYYVITRGEIENSTWEYTKNGQISNVGFSVTGKEMAEVIVTGIYDSKTELVCAYKKLSTSEIETEATKFGFEIKVILATDNNVRLTDIGVYLRFSELEDFQQLKVFHLTNSSEAKYKAFYITSIDPNGIYSLQTLGVPFVKESYSPFTIVQDYKLVDGISFCLKDNQVYNCAIGNGAVLTDLFYKENVIPGLATRPITRLANINNAIAIATAEEIKPLAIEATQFNTIIASIKDTMGIGVNSRYNLTESPDGVIVNTRTGIYATNGYDKSLLSEEINDVVEANIDNSSIFYDISNKELYYFTTTATYRYSFITKTWNTFDALLPVNSFVGIDHSYNLLFITPLDSVKKMEATNGTTGEIKSHLNDLGSLGTYKVIDGVTIDFEGSITIFGLTITNATRKNIDIFVPTANRVPARQIQYDIIIYGGAKIYNIELNFINAGNR